MKANLRSVQSNELKFESVFSTPVYLPDRARKGSTQLSAGFLFGTAYHHCMKVDLDPEFLRTSMTLWRDAVDMKMRVHDDFKIHFMQNRAKLLEGFAKTATSWSMVLNACKQETPETETLAQLKADVEEFKKWAEDGLAQIRAL